MSIIIDGDLDTVVDNSFNLIGYWKQNKGFSSSSITSAFIWVVNVVPFTIETIFIRNILDIVGIILVISSEMIVASSNPNCKSTITHTTITMVLVVCKSSDIVPRSLLGEESWCGSEPFRPETITVLSNSVNWSIITIIEFNVCNWVSNTWNNIIIISVSIC